MRRIAFQAYDECSGSANNLLITECWQVMEMKLLGHALNGLFLSIPNTRR